MGIRGDGSGERLLNGEVGREEEKGNGPIDRGTRAGRWC